MIINQSSRLKFKDFRIYKYRTIFKYKERWLVGNHVTFLTGNWYRSKNRWICYLFDVGGERGLLSRKTNLRAHTLMAQTYRPNFILEFNWYFLCLFIEKKDNFLINFIKNGALSFAKVRKMVLFVFIYFKKKIISGLTS